MRERRGVILSLRHCATWEVFGKGAFLHPYATLRHALPNIVGMEHPIVEYKASKVIRGITWRRVIDDHPTPLQTPSVAR